MSRRDSHDDDQAPEPLPEPVIQPLTRRELLIQAGAVAGTITLAGVLGCADEAAVLPPPNATPDAGSAADAGARSDVTAGDDHPVAADAQADAADGPDGQLAPLRGDGSHPFDYIDTLVIVQMENRSFDHYFGSLALTEGRGDLEGLRAGMSNPAPDGTPVPIRPLADDWVIDPDPPHSHDAATQQYDQGANDGFVKAWFDSRLASLSPADAAAKLDLVMGYQTRHQLPAAYGLADAFTVCDRWHSALLGPTWPNRFYSHCATSSGVTTNLMPINAPTPYPLLVERGLTYATYYTNLYFLLVLTSVPSPPARLMDDFFADAAAGTLPNVSIVEPDIYMNDDHPPHDIRQGQLFIASIYEALRQSPQWNRSLMLVFYDEHGGFHDHVPPPPSQGNVDGDAFARLGFRVPGLVIGPLARRGSVLHTLVEHSSVPSLICRLFGLPQLNRRAELAGDLAEALTLDLLPNRLRPAPPALGPLDFTSQELEQLAERVGKLRCGQPELLEYAISRGKVPQNASQVFRRRYRNFLDHALKLGALRVR